MGSRYSFYLKHIGVDVIGRDLNDNKWPSDVDGVLIATPTEYHFNHIWDMWDRYNRPILCEKAISKNLDKTENICKSDIQLRMINQYEYFKPFFMPGGTSHYDYYKHGSDGIAFDCINIIGLADGVCGCDERSPQWSCVINNYRINLADMDSAYLWNLRDWIIKEDENKDYILHAHRRVNLWING